MASRWSEATQHKTELGWGRYLFFLHERSELAPSAGPADRITRERVAAYLAELQRTNRGHTIQNRIQELGDAMRALAPEGDWHWIRGPPADCGQARFPRMTNAHGYVPSKSLSPLVSG